MARYEIDNYPSEIDWQETDIIKRTLQNAKNLLMCQMGEVPYDRYRGFDPELFDMTFPELEVELLPELDRIMLWEPDVEVEDAHAVMLDDGSTYIRVTLQVGITEPEGDE